MFYCANAPSLTQMDEGRGEGGGKKKKKVNGFESEKLCPFVRPTDHPHPCSLSDDHLGQCVQLSIIVSSSTQHGAFPMSHHLLKWDSLPLVKKVRKNADTTPLKSCRSLSPSLTRTESRNLLRSYFAKTRIEAEAASICEKRPSSSS